MNNNNNNLSNINFKNIQNNENNLNNGKKRTLKNKNKNKDDKNNNKLSKKINNILIIENNKKNNKKNNENEKNKIISKNTYYPSIHDKNFNKKIYNHLLFKKYKYPNVSELFNNLLKSYENNKDMSDKTKLNLESIFKLSLSQKFLRNFMSPYSPFNGVFIIHGTGVGKTCTAITIAEQIKNNIVNNNKLIHIIRSDEFKRQIFEIDKVKNNKIDFQCTGNEYIKNEKYDNLVNDCIDGNVSSCELLEKNVNKDLKKIYNFTTPRTWANNIKNLLERRIKNKDTNEKNNIIKKIIERLFNDSVLIIDEVHNLRDSDSDSEKIVPPILNMVLKYSKNLKLIMLSATPMFDKPQNIVSLLNYLLLNDNRKPIKENEIFDMEGGLKKDGDKKLINISRGYISYLRGNNPFEFPIRISAKYNIPKKMVDLNKYPKKDIYNRDISTKIKYLDLVDCPFNKNQKEIFNMYKKKNINNNEKNESIVKKDDDFYLEPSVAHSNELQMSNFIYKSFDESYGNIKNTYGDIGFNTTFKKLGSNYTYKFINPDDYKKFTLPEIKNWGTKIGSLLENIEKSNGPVFVYTFFTASGVLPLAMALEMAGYKRYKMHSTPLLEDPNKSKDYKGDYIIYTGNEKLSSNAELFFNKRQAMIKDKNVKIVIGSSKASEGLNLFGFREVHILDPWHNLSLIEQSIGRVIRKGSHNHLPPRDRNVSVYMYASTLENNETIDLKIYKIAEDKMIKTSKIESILKRNAIDCQLNLNINMQNQKNFNKKIPIITSHNKNVEIDLSDQPFTKNCLYSKNCNYKCIGFDETTNKINEEKNTNNKISYLMKNIDKDSNEYKQLIINILKNHFNININYLTSYLDIDKKNNELEFKILYSTIENLVNSEETFKDFYGRVGYAKLDGDFLRFIPIKSVQPNVSLQYQHSNIGVDVEKVDYLELINEKNKKLKKLQEFKKVNYIEILNGYQTNLGSIINNNIKNMKSNYDRLEEEIIFLTFHKLIYENKKVILENIIKKIINKEILVEFEIKLLNCIKLYLINNKYNLSYLKLDLSLNASIQKTLDTIRNNILGFIIQKKDKLIFFRYDENENKFIENNIFLKNIIEINKFNSQLTNNNKLYGYLSYDSSTKYASFKIVDLIQKGIKKSVTGFKCVNSSIQIIKKYILSIDKNYSKTNLLEQKNIFCNDFELLLMKKNNTDSKVWYYTAEHYSIIFN